MKEERILAIDYGLKRVGIAITDPLKMFASPLITLKNDDRFWINLLKLFSDYEVCEVVLGYPLRENGEKSHITDDVIEFKNELEKKISQQVVFVDERYSSSIAKERVIASVVSKKKRRDKGIIDKNAAAVILEEYLREKLL
ncbi:MAG: Holliday junction resolvase RuvX [Melioribacteraceae bacterium]|nr:Holliday junction resolvase RuvX [Melioribacteraceae bacterium]